MIWSVLIYSDLKQVSKSYILVQSKQRCCLVGQDFIQPPESQIHYIHKIIRLAAHKLCTD